jgi:iron(III) transport system substrate-binding protein
MRIYPEKIAFSFVSTHIRRVTWTVILCISICFFLVTPKPRAASLDWKVDWQRTLQAARKEGRLVVLGLLGRTYQDALKPFQNEYPEIRLEVMGARGRDITPRIRAEREAGQYLWDVFLNAPTTGLLFKRMGYLAPLRPQLILPEVLASDKWLGGFEDGWLDAEQRFLYGYTGLTNLAHINRDILSEKEINSVEQLIDPRWKGKIVTDDPRRAGTAHGQLAHLLMVLGESWTRRFLANDLVIVDNPRQLAEFVYRGQYPIALGLRSGLYDEFKKQGVVHVKPLAPKSKADAYLSIGRVVGLFDRASHPNAAKLFVNWVLRREAQQHFSDITETSNRRLDVLGPAETAADPKLKYRSVLKEENERFQHKAIEIAKEVFGVTR